MKLQGTIQKLSIRKIGTDDWRCQYVEIWGGGKFAMFEFDGEMLVHQRSSKISKLITRNNFFWNNT